MSFRVVILSKSPQNLIRCVRAIFKREPGLDSKQIIVVDDGIREKGDDGPIVVDGQPLTAITGEKPFVFARNANIGFRAAGEEDVILLNDDALLLNDFGFTGLSRVAASHPDFGVISSSVSGIVCNPRQHPYVKGLFQEEPEMIAFICVYIPRKAYQAVGPLDERFTGYGYDDNDYCERVKSAGFRLGIWHGCLVDHSQQRFSTYRTRPDWSQIYAQNRQLFEQKRATAHVV
jgi:GT2 family glycosyltransferase